MVRNREVLLVVVALTVSGGALWSVAEGPSPVREAAPVMVGPSPPAAKVVPGPASPIGEVPGEGHPVALYVKDAPFDAFTNVTVRLEGASLRRADGGWVPLPGVDRTLDLFTYRHPEARAHLTTVRVPPGAYDAVAFNVTSAQGVLAETVGLVIPLPVVSGSAVAERGFVVGETGNVTRLVVDLSLRESIRATEDGYVFQPSASLARVRHLAVDPGYDVMAPDEERPSAAPPRPAF